MVARGARTAIKEPVLEEVDLIHPDCFPHRVDSIHILDSLESWIVRAGEYWYRIRKPVELEYVDYSTPERRRKAGEAEVSASLRFAPGHRLEVVPVSLVSGKVKFCDSTNIIDWVVRKGVAG